MTWRSRAPTPGGAQLYDNPEQAEKRRIGELWARRAGDRYRFVMPKQRDWALIRAAALR
jgi:type III restriction enzyme